MICRVLPGVLYIGPEGASITLEGPLRSPRGPEVGKFSY